MSDGSWETQHVNMVACPVCTAEAGENCKTAHGIAHQERITATMEQQAASKNPEIDGLKALVQAGDNALGRRLLVADMVREGAVGDQVAKADRLEDQRALLPTWRWLKRRRLEREVGRLLSLARYVERVIPAMPRGMQIHTPAWDSQHDGDSLWQYRAMVDHEAQVRRDRLDAIAPTTFFEIAVTFLDGDEVMVQASGVPGPLSLYKETGPDLAHLLAGAREAIEQHRERFTS